MLRVYLDQMAWVDLTKAALGRPRRPEHTTALEIARYGVTHGLVEFPLSSIHYMETLQRKNAQSREEVGSLMVELSQMRTMAGPPDIQDEEIDRALRARFGRPTIVRSQPVFGRGVGFAFGEKPYRYVCPPELAVDEETKRRIEDQFSEIMERAVLAGPSARFGIHEVPGIEHSRQIAERHAEEERQIGELIRKGGFKGERFREVWIARGLGEAIGDINRALINAGIHPDEFAGLGKDGLTQFFLDIPVLSSYWELRFIRHQNPKLGWTGNDLDVYDTSGKLLCAALCGELSAQGRPISRWELDLADELAKKLGSPANDAALEASHDIARQLLDRKKGDLAKFAGRRKHHERRAKEVMDDSVRDVLRIAESSPAAPKRVVPETLAAAVADEEVYDVLIDETTSEVPHVAA